MKPRLILVASLLISITSVYSVSAQTVECSAQNPDPCMTQVLDGAGLKCRGTEADATHFDKITRLPTDDPAYKYYDAPMDPRKADGMGLTLDSLEADTQQILTKAKGLGINAGEAMAYLAELATKDLHQECNTQLGSKNCTYFKDVVKIYAHRTKTAGNHRTDSTILYFIKFGRDDAYCGLKVTAGKAYDGWTTVTEAKNLLLRLMSQTKNLIDESKKSAAEGIKCPQCITFLNNPAELPEKAVGQLTVEELRTHCIEVIGPFESTNGEGACCEGLTTQDGFAPVSDRGTKDYEQFLAGLNQPINDKLGVQDFQIEKYCPTTYGQQKACDTCVGFFKSGAAANPNQEKWCMDYFLKDVGKEKQNVENACCTELSHYFTDKAEGNYKKFSEEERDYFVKSNVPKSVQGMPDLESRLQNYPKFCSNSVGAFVTTPTCEQCKEWEKNGTLDDNTKEFRKKACETVYADPKNKDIPACGLLTQTDDALCTECFDHILMSYQKDDPSIETLKDIKVNSMDDLMASIQGSRYASGAQAQNSIGQCKAKIESLACCDNLASRLLDELGFNTIQDLKTRIQEPEMQATICKQAPGYLHTLTTVCKAENEQYNEIRDIIGQKCIKACPVSDKTSDFHNAQCCIGVLNAEEDGNTDYKANAENLIEQQAPTGQPEIEFDMATNQCRLALRPEAKKIYPSNLLCKRYASWQMYKAVASASADAPYSAPANHEEFMQLYNAVFSSDELAAGESTQGEIFNSSTTRDESGEQDNSLGEDFQKWYGDNATSGMGRYHATDTDQYDTYRQNFCNHEFNSEIALLFCSEKDLTLVRELHDQFCGDAANLCDICVVNAKVGQPLPAACNNEEAVQVSCCDKAKTEMTPIEEGKEISDKECKDIKAKAQTLTYWNTADTAIIPPEIQMYSTSAESGACGICGGNVAPPLDANAYGPCDQIANLSAVIITEPGTGRFEKITNPFILDEYGTFLEDNDHLASLVEAKELIEAEDRAYKGDILNNEENRKFNGCQKKAVKGWSGMVGGRTPGSKLDKKWSLSWAIFIQKILTLTKDPDSIQDLYVDCKTAEDKAFAIAKLQPNSVECQNADTNGVTCQGFIYRSQLTPEEVELFLEKKGLIVPDANGESALKTAATKIKKQALEHLEEIRKCTALVHLTGVSEVDYDDVEVDNKTEKASADGSITCVRKGALTQDYKGCDNLITVYDVALIAEQALVMAQQIDFQGKQNEWALEFQKDEDQVKAPIKLQIKTLEAQRDYTRVQAAGYQAKAASLGVASHSMPTIKTIIEDSDKDYYDKAGEADYIWVTSFFGNTEGIKDEKLDDTFKMDYSADKPDISTTAVCSNVVRHDELGLIKNDLGKEQGGGQALQAQIKAVEQFAIAELIDDNIDKLNAMLRGITDFEPEDLNYTMEDLIAQECEVNPSAPACGNTDPTMTEVGFLGSNIIIGGNGASGTGDYSLPDQDGVVGMDNTTGTDSSGGSGKLAPIDFGKNGQAGLKGNFNRASVKSNNAGFSSSGGGGSAGRMAGATGGGGRNNASRGKTRYQAKKYSYKGKSKSLSYGGGSNKSRKGKSKSNNLFGKLFKKKNKVVNYRNLASDGKIGKASGRNIFKMLSDRYDNIAAKKRLLEYEKSK